MPHVSTIAEALVDIVLLHSDLDHLARSAGIVRIQHREGSSVEFDREYFGSADAVRDRVTSQPDSIGLKSIKDTDLKRILPVAIAEHFISFTEAKPPRPEPEVITEAVAFGNREVYLKFMVPLCNSQPHVVVTRRALVALSGHLPPGSMGQEPLSVDGDIGVCVSDEGRQAPHVIRISRKQPDGKLARLRKLPPEARELYGRTDPDAYMHIPVGRMADVTVTVVGIMDTESYEENFLTYERWVKERL
jgi:hypothetical protein